MKQSKVVVANVPPNSEIDCISEMNGWNELIFCKPVLIPVNKKAIEIFLGEHDKKWAWPVYSRCSKIDCI